MWYYHWKVISSIQSFKWHILSLLMEMLVLFCYYVRSVIKCQTYSQGAQIIQRAKTSWQRFSKNQAVKIFYQWILFLCFILIVVWITMKQNSLTFHSLPRTLCYFPIVTYFPMFGNTKIETSFLLPLSGLLILSIFSPK